MKILFINKSRNFLLRNSALGGASFMLFTSLSYISTPDLFRTPNIWKNDTIVNIELKSEYHVAIKSPQSKTYWFYEVLMKNDNTKYIINDEEKIKKIGISKLLNQEVKFQFSDYSDPKYIISLYIGNKAIIERANTGLFPFMLFFPLSLVALAWSIWAISIKGFSFFE